MTKNDHPEKFRNRYRIPSARAAWWDYAAAAAYFITICTAGRAHLFGAVRNGQMVLSRLGEIVREEWEKSFEIRAELVCDIYIIMPNHIHAIVRIVDDENVAVETHGRASLRRRYGVAYRAPKSISSFVAGFKSAATKRINAYRDTPGAAVWQSRFHDHIIRNRQEYHRIAAYIASNPARWQGDRYFHED